MTANSVTWTVRFGQSVRQFATEYHAGQFCRALALNGTAYTIEATPPFVDVQFETAYGQTCRLSRVIRVF